MEIFQNKITRVSAFIDQNAGISATFTHTKIHQTVYYVKFFS